MSTDNKNESPVAAPRGHRLHFPFRQTISMQHPASRRRFDQGFSVIPDEQDVFLAAQIWRQLP